MEREDEVEPLRQQIIDAVKTRHDLQQPVVKDAASSLTQTIYCSRNDGTEIRGRVLVGRVSRLHSCGFVFQRGSDLGDLRLGQLRFFGGLPPFQFVACARLASAWPSHTASPVIRATVFTSKIALSGRLRLFRAGKFFQEGSTQIAGCEVSTIAGELLRPFPDLPSLGFVATVLPCEFSQASSPAAFCISEIISG